MAMTSRASKKFISAHTTTTNGQDLNLTITTANTITILSGHRTNIMVTIMASVITSGGGNDFN